MNTSNHTVTLINPRSILSGAVANLDGSLKPYPKRASDDWWVLWDGETPLAYFVCREWHIDCGYGVVHYRGNLNAASWSTLIEALASYAESQGYYNLFLITALLSEVPNVTLEYKNRQVREFLLTPQTEEQTEDQEIENANLPVHMPGLPIYL